WSENFGATWIEPGDGNVKFPQDSGLSLNAIWALEPAPLVGPDGLFAGTDPAALYRSDDRGEAFHPVESLLQHNERRIGCPDLAGSACIRFCRILAILSWVAGFFEGRPYSKGWRTTMRFDGGFEIR